MDKMPYLPSNFQLLTPCPLRKQPMKSALFPKFLNYNEISYSSLSKILKNAFEGQKYPFLVKLQAHSVCISVSLKHPFETSTAPIIK